MFEEEAKEFSDKYNIMNEDLSPKSPRHIVLEVFKDGAEFGYNKCFEQIRKLVNDSTRLDCIIPMLLRMQKKMVVSTEERPLKNSTKKENDNDKEN